MTTQFDRGLELLDLKNIGSASSKSLYRTDEITSQLSPDIFFALETAKKFKADAVYFRQFSNGQPPMPQIYLYDRTENDLNQEELNKIHKDLWSGHVVPIFIVVDKLSVRIVDSRAPIESNGLNYQSDPFAQFEFAATSIQELEKAKKFSSSFFDNGTFWENEYSKNHFLEEKSVYYYFIAGLKKFRKFFGENSKLDKLITDKLLVLSILVKYLEERGDSDSEKFAAHFFQKIFRVKNFSEAIRKGKIVDVFKEFNKEDRFNGGVFKWSEEEETKLRQADLSKLANFLDANLENDSQYLIWRQYSFEYLPVELISNVYEEFLGEGSKDVVYTPKFLVDLLINQTMPLDKTQKDFKVIDVSCGSGIFLVSAFKRLVEWWRIENNNQIPEPKVLFKILRNQVFGVDIDKSAARLSIFSLCLALCDKLTPRQIWQPLTFMDLSENNILADDFFIYLAKNKDDESVRFDLVIGNPPFNPPKGVKNSTYFNKIKKDILTDVAKVPDDNLALLFLDQAMRLVKKDAQLCLILKSAPLLYNLSEGAVAFRKTFFERYNVNQVLDFSNLKKVLFGKVNVETSAIVVTNQTPNFEEDVLHLIVRRTSTVEKKLFFELDYYDFNFIDRENVINNSYVWKSNLLGGGRLSYLLQRLRSFKTLGEYTTAKEEIEGWDVRQGYRTGKHSKCVPAPFISEHNVIRADNFFDFDTLPKDVLFDSPKTENLFKPFNLLIRRVIDANNSIPNRIVQVYAPFDENIVGIHVNEKDLNEIIDIKSYLDKYSQTLSFFALVNESRFFLHATTSVGKKDIMALPYPKNMEDLELNYAETILRDDVLNYRIEQLYKGEDAKINALTEPNQIEDFGEVYCLALNSFGSKDGREFYFSKIWDTPSVFVTEFKLSHVPLELVKEERKNSNIEAILNFKDENRNFNIQRIIRHYTQDAVYLIKPKQLRYWLKSIALRDADETLNDFIVLEK
jgi:N-6 DNA Methylase